MNKYFAYIRVSTAKQGEGVSLDAQRDAISRYADQNDFSIKEWFEEKVTAAKFGRPKFGKMLSELKKKKACGVIIHKIDRSARNLRDWVELVELCEQGIEVHFAHESMNLNARGGRLSADIQAVIATDYIRNLREESIKGIYARLKQGIYPFKAPLGYLDTGAGNPKKIDTVKAPMIKRTFELYATGKYNLLELQKAVKGLGMTNTNGGPVTKTGLSTILNNPFYIGLIRVKGNTYQGKHEAIVSPNLFNTVKRTLQNRNTGKNHTHSYTLSRRLQCAYCGKLMTAERHNNIVYYRCHRQECPSNFIREDWVLTYIHRLFQLFQFSDREKNDWVDVVNEQLQDQQGRIRKILTSLRLRLEKINTKIDKLTDHFLEGNIDNECYKRKQEQYYNDKAKIEADIEAINKEKARINNIVEGVLLRLGNLAETFRNADLEQKIKLIDEVFSKLEVKSKKVYFTIQSPYLELANRWKFETGGLIRDSSREYGVKFVSSGKNTSPISGRSLTKGELELLCEAILDQVDVWLQVTDEGQEI